MDERMKAERAVLGGILINNDAIQRIKAIIGPDDFRDRRNKRIFTLMLSLWAINKPIHLITLNHASFCFGDWYHGQIGTIGESRVDYLASLVDAVSTSKGLEKYALQMKEGK